MRIATYVEQVLMRRWQRTIAMRAARAHMDPMPDRHTPATRNLRPQTAIPYGGRKRWRRVRTIATIVISLVVLAVVILLIVHTPFTSSAAHAP